MLNTVFDSTRNWRKRPCKGANSISTVDSRLTSTRRKSSYCGRLMSLKFSPSLTRSSKALTKASSSGVGKKRMRLTGKGAPKSQKNVAPAWLCAVLNTPDEEVAGSPSIRSRGPASWLKKPSLDHARGWPPRVKSRGWPLRKRCPEARSSSMRFSPTCSCKGCRAPSTSNAPICVSACETHESPPLPMCHTSTWASLGASPPSTTRRVPTRDLGARAVIS